MAAAKPVILLAFANDPADGINYLRNLPEEARQLRVALEYGRSQGLCDFELLYGATLDDILGAFRNPNLRGRIAVFHYGGHADSYELLFQARSGNTERIDGRGFAAFLAEQPSLQLVFLNACMTEPQVESLLAANVQIVIATSQEIDDEVASSLAGQFYGELAHGATVGSSYRQAVAALRAQKGDDPTLFYTRGAAPIVEQIEPDTATAPVASGPGGSASGGYWPWMLRTRPGAEIAAEWSLPLATGDPLFGLPSLPARPLPESPYQRALDYYTRDMAELFFGRGAQIRSLYQRVTAAGHSSVILYYGQSGVGKSSLLDAGLAPRLDPTHLVSYARRDRSLGLLGTLRRQLAALALSPAAEPPGVETPTIAETWLAAEQATGKPVVLILDQVEEVFTRRNPEQPTELKDFAAALRSIDGGQNQPQGTLLLGFRKEHLAEIVSALRDQRVAFVGQYLAPLDAAGIEEVVRGPTSTERLRARYGLTVENDLPQVIAHDLTSDPESPVAPTLNILLRKLWAAATAEAASSPHFSVAVYEKLRREGILLDDFLRQQSATLAQEQPAAVASGLLLDLWAFHTTPLGTSDHRDAEELRRAYGERTGLDALVLRSKELYVLADPPGDSANAGTRLAHDTLAPLVRRDFEHSTLPGQQARRLLESRAVDWSDGQTGAIFDDAALGVVGKGLDGMRGLTAHEKRLLDASRYAQARRQRQRRLWSMAAAAAAVVIMVLLAAVLLFRYNQQVAENRLLEERIAEHERTQALQLAQQLSIQREIHARDQGKINESQRIAQLAQQQLGADPVAGLHLALAANAEQLRVRGATIPDAEYVLRQAVLTSRERKYVPVTVTAPDQIAIGGSRIAAGGAAPAVYDLKLEVQDFAFPAEFTDIQGLRWDDEERLLGWSHQAVWVVGGEQPQQFPLPLDDGEAVRCAEWQPTHQWVAICTWNQLYAWELATNRVVTLTTELDTLDLPTEPRSAAWSQDGRWLAGSGARLVVWDSEAPNEEAQLYYPPDEAGNAVSFAYWLPGDRSLVAGWPDLFGMTQLHIWRDGVEELETVPLPAELHDRSGVDALYVRDEQSNTPRLLFWSADGFLALYDLDGSRQAQAIGVPLNLRQPMLAPSGKYVVGYAADGTATVWTLPELEVFQRLDRSKRFVAGALESAAWLADNTLVLSDDTGLVQVVRMGEAPMAEIAVTHLVGYRAGERPVQVLLLDDGQLLTAGLSDDGEGTSLRIWQLDPLDIAVDQGLPAASAPLCERLYRSVVLPPGLAVDEIYDWQPDGRLTLGGAQQVAHWQLGSTAQVLPLNEELYGYELAPDSTQVLRFGGADGEIWRLGAGGWQQAGTLPGPIEDANWSPHGILVQYADQSSAVVDPARGERRLLPPGTLVASSFMLAPDLVLATSRERVKLWNLEEDREVDSWAVPGGARLDLDDVSSDGRTTAWQSRLFGRLYVLQLDPTLSTLTERWQSQRASVATAPSALHPTQPLLATVHNGVASIVDWEQGTTIWQSRSVAEAAAQIFSSVWWSTDGQYLITQATPPQPSTVDVNIGVWRWDDQLRRLILVQEMPSTGLLGISPDSQSVLAVDPGRLATDRALFYPVLADTIQLRQDVLRQDTSNPCLLSRSLDAAQRQAFAMEER